MTLFNTSELEAIVEKVKAAEAYLDDARQMLAKATRQPSPEEIITGKFLALPRGAVFLIGPAANRMQETRYFKRQNSVTSEYGVNTGWGFKEFIAMLVDSGCLEAHEVGKVNG